MASPKPNTGNFDPYPSDSPDDGQKRAKTTTKPAAIDEQAAVEPTPSSKIGKDMVAASRSGSKTSRSAYHSSSSKLINTIPLEMDTSEDYEDATGVHASKELPFAKGKGKSIASGSEGAAIALTEQDETSRRRLRPMMAANAIGNFEVMEGFKKQANEVYSLAESLREALNIMEPAILSATKKLEKVKELVNADLGTQPVIPKSSVFDGGVSGYEGSDEPKANRPKRRERRRRVARSAKTPRTPKRTQDGENDQKERPDPKNPDNFMSTDPEDSSD
ncbi:hypothetical protein F5B18DRAFT_657553 [Nemania serpens]|nr:hypothetical protein F5B18DRAFT_657553 [Nemania serpens]